MANIHELLTWSETLLTQAGVSTPRIDAEWTLAHILNCSRSDFHVNASKTLTSNQDKSFRDLIHRRAKRMPLQHILGQTEFYALLFYTTPSALIPRPDTETLIKIVKQHAPAQARILDIGTGSGIIAITLAHELPTARVIATDISSKALHLAQRNAQLNNVLDRVNFIQGDLFSPLKGTFDIIISNPPYIPTRTICTLQPEVQHDPLLALDGGADGLDFYRTMIPSSSALLLPGGFLCFEIGHDQGSDVSSLLKNESNWAHIEIYNDLAGHPRVVSAQKPK